MAVVSGTGRVRDGAGMAVLPGTGRAGDGAGMAGDGAGKVVAGLGGRLAETEVGAGGGDPVGFKRLLRVKPLLAGLAAGVGVICPLAQSAQI